MQGVRLHHHPAPDSNLCMGLAAAATSRAVVAAATTTAAPLSIEEEEPVEKRIERLIAENPVIIFSRTSCCMCHVMKRLFSNVGVHPTVIELDEAEMEPAMGSLSSLSSSPAVFIGGVLVGGLESLMKLHLGGHLVPRLQAVGALWM